MKHLIRSFVVLILAGALAPLAHAKESYEFELAKNDFTVVDEVNVPSSQDPNSEDFVPSDEAAEKPAAAEKSVKVIEPFTEEKPMTVAKPPEAPKPIKEAKPVKPAAPKPLDIPLIETHNEVSSHAGVTYVTGGIGDDEREAIEASKADYNLLVTSASTSGAFVGDARVVISRKDGATNEQMLSVVAGPLLYVRLPAGSYVLDATLGEQKKHQAFTVSKKGTPARVQLGWKVSAGN